MQNIFKDILKQGDKIINILLAIYVIKDILLVLTLDPNGFYNISFWNTYLQSIIKVSVIALIGILIISISQRNIIKRIILGVIFPIATILIVGYIQNIKFNKEKMRIIESNNHVYTIVQNISHDYICTPGYSKESFLTINAKNNEIINIQYDKYDDYYESQYGQTNDGISTFGVGKIDGRKLLTPNHYDDKKAYSDCKDINNKTIYDNYEIIYNTKIDFKSEVEYEQY